MGAFSENRMITSVNFYRKSLFTAIYAVFFTLSGIANATSEFGSYLAGRHAQALNDGDKASTFMMRVLAENPDDQELLKRTFLLTLSAGKFTMAISLAKRIETGGGKMATAALLLGIDAARIGDFDAARKRFDALPRRGLNAYAAPLASAWSSAGAKDFDAALSTLAELDKKSGFSAMRDLHTGLINDLANRPEAAEENYRSVADELHNAPIRVVRAAGSLFERTGRKDEARKLYQNFLAAHPANVAVGDTLERMEAGESAQPLIDSAKFGISESLFNIASALPRDRSTDMALIYARIALYLKPNFELARLLLGNLFDNQQRYAKANEIYEQIDATSPYHWSARLRIAKNLSNLDNVDEAIEMLRRMVEVRPNRTDALITLGGILRSKERYQAAVEAYDAASERLGEIKPGHWLFFYNRGIALERSKSWARAEKDFLKALELRPEQPYVLNYLGYSWVEKGFNIERAKKMIERAVEQRHDDGYIVDSLGWVLYRLGDYAASVKHLERAIRLRPSDPVINDHLGDAYWRVGRKLEARFQWRRALGLDPDEDQVPDIEAKLENGLKQDKSNGSGG
jgi:tetratricopeptide (TPR) repeat protein